MIGPYAILVVGAGALANLLIAAMFVARVIAPDLARPLGAAGTAMAIPLALASLIALRTAADPWSVALPLVFVAFAAFELVADMILGLPLRTTGWLWPYLLLFYAGQWAVIGAAFLADRSGGFVVLVSYLVCLAATAYSFRVVGHGLPGAA